MARPKTIILMIFLFSLFIFLAVFIALQILATYREGTVYSTNTTKGVLECNTLSFRISSLKYGDKVLEFEIESYEPELADMVILHNDMRTHFKLKPFFGDTQKVRIENITLGEGFIIFPDGCEQYNKKECLLVDSKCKNI